MMKPLLREGKLTNGDWIDMLEAARARVLPKLERMKLKRFGELACLDDRSGCYRQIELDKPLWRGEYALSDHGMAYFTDDRQSVTRLGQKRTIGAWGLSRKGEWVTITVAAVAVPEEKSPDGLRECAECVSILPASLETMLGLSGALPYHVFMTIKSEVDRWDARKALLHQESSAMADDFRILEALLLSKV